MNTSMVMASFPLTANLLYDLTKQCLESLSFSFWQERKNRIGT
jgi:hypothetical protein